MARQASRGSDEMNIDERVEPLVRAALDAAVHRDQARFETALGAFEDDSAARKGIELVLAVIATVLVDLYDGTPSASQLDELAADISRQEAWLEPTPSEVRSLLVSVAGGRPLAEVLPPEQTVILAYLTAANLLASGSEPDQGEWWFNYLDKVEAALEAAPDRT